MCAYVFAFMQQRECLVRMKCVPEVRDGPFLEGHSGGNLLCIAANLCKQVSL